MMDWFKRLIAKKEKEHLEPDDTLNREVEEIQERIRRQLDDTTTDHNLDDAVEKAKALAERTLTWVPEEVESPAD